MGTLLMTEDPKGTGGHTAQPTQAATTTGVCHFEAGLVVNDEPVRSTTHTSFEKLTQISSP